MDCPLPCYFKKWLGRPLWVRDHNCNPRGTRPNVCARRAGRGQDSVRVRERKNGSSSPDEASQGGACMAGVLRCHWQRPLALSSFVEEGERCRGLSLSVSSSLARDGDRLAGRAVSNPVCARSAERGQDSVRVSERRQRPHGPGLARDERAPVPRLVPVQGWRPAKEGSPA